MRETITVTLPEGMKSAIDGVTRKEGISPAELVTQALEEYLFLRRFRLLRERMVQKAKEGKDANTTGTGGHSGNRSSG
ncbi:MAG: hypothetical protein Kow00123_11300 [Anaerolineales bacterium]